MKWGTSANKLDEINKRVETIEPIIKKVEYMMDFGKAAVMIHYGLN